MSVATPAAYLAALPPDRRKELSRVRAVIRKHLPKGYVETIEFGSIAYVIPLERYPNTYNKRPLMLASLASQKGFMALYLMSVHGDPLLRRWFEDAFRAAGKKLDMGKSCVRFKSADDLPLDVIGDAIGRVGVADYLAKYEALRPPKTASQNVTEKKAASGRRRA